MASLEETEMAEDADLHGDTETRRLERGWAAALRAGTGASEAPAHPRSTAATSCVSPRAFRDKKH